MRLLFVDRDLKLKLCLNINFCIESIFTIRRTENYSLCKVVANLYDRIDTEELNIVRWISGSQNFADVLTMRNLTSSRRLNDMLDSGMWMMYLSQSCEGALTLGAKQLSIYKTFYWKDNIMTSWESGGHRSPSV